VAQLRRRTILARTVLAAVVATTLLGPASSDAQSGPDPAKTQRRLDQVRAQRGRVALDVDALAARENQVRAAVAKLSGNVDRQQARLDEAERAADEADAEVVAATKAVASAQTRIDQLNLITDGLVVEAYVNPPSDNALEAFRADSIIDSAVKETLVDLQSDADADALDQLKQAHEDLAVQKAEKEDLAAAAEKKRADAEAALGDLQNALDQQQTFQDQLEERLNAKLAEAESLKTFDRKLADQLVREQAQVAAYLRALERAAEAQRRAEAAAAARAAAAAAAAGRAAPVHTGGGGAAPSVIAPAPGGLATVTCPHGGSITVAGSIAGDVQRLLNAAAADGVSLCASSGWRSPQKQIALRRAHCGSSYYAIYQMPSSQCHPPTARPGSSLHEQGLAIDFSCNGGGAIRWGNSCWNWLAAHASSYGLYNLPSEPWHWSTTGR
jgi:LAS superfamily LD-carboxypeptidase LdcB